MYCCIREVTFYEVIWNGKKIIRDNLKYHKIWIILLFYIFPNNLLMYHTSYLVSWRLFFPNTLTESIALKFFINIEFSCFAYNQFIITSIYIFVTVEQWRLKKWTNEWRLHCKKHRMNDYVLFQINKKIGLICQCFKIWQ